MPENDIERADGPKAAHAIAQTLCHQKHADWRYDPGNPDHEGFYEDALELLAAALPFLPEYLSEVDSREGHAEPHEPPVTVAMAREAARTFVNVLLDAAAGDGPPNREWLLWGVGLIAQAGKVSEGGPDA